MDLSNYQNQISENERKRNEGRKSQQYIQTISYTNNLLNDFNDSLIICQLYSTRNYEFSNNSLLIWSLREVMDSVECIRENIEHGYLHPATRELRYILESIIKYVFTDQKCEHKALTDRFKYFHNFVPRSSVTPITQEIPAINEEIRHDINSVFSSLSSYIHPSKAQMEKYLSREHKGTLFTFENFRDISTINKLLFKTLDIALKFIFIGIGIVTSREALECIKSVKPNWKFNKSKYSY